MATASLLLNQGHILVVGIVGSNDRNERYGFPLPNGCRCPVERNARHVDSLFAGIIIPPELFSSGVQAAIAARMEMVERKANSRLIWCYMVIYPINVLIQQTNYL